MSNQKNYAFHVEEIIDGISKYDFDTLRGLKNPFENIENVRAGISYACKWDPRTSWFTDCRPSFEAQGELRADTLMHALKDISRIFSGISLKRIEIKKINENQVETEYTYTNGNLSVTPSGKNPINVHSKHQFYQNFCKLTGISGGVENEV